MHVSFWRPPPLLGMLFLLLGVLGCMPNPLSAAEPPPHPLYLPYLSVPSSSPTPIPGATWSALYGEEGAEEVEGLAATQDGGLVMAGISDSFADENGDAWVLKVGGEGQTLWQYTYGGDEEDALVDIQQTPDGGWIAAGWTQSFGVEQTDMWVVRLDQEGQPLWAKTYGGPGIEQAWSVALTGDGGYLIAGGTTSFGHGDADYWVLRLDAQGEILWQKTYGGPGDDGGGGEYEEFVVQALVDKEGNYVVAGESASFGAGETDIWVLKLRPDGSVIWQKAYGGEYEESLWRFTEVSGGGYLLPGVSVTFSPDFSGDMWVLRLNSDGSIRWQKLFGLADDWDEALSVGPTRDGGAVIGGYVEQGGKDWDMSLLRIDAQGDLQWQRRYEYGWDWPNAIVEMADGSLAVAGVGWDRDHGRDEDLWAMRLTSTGMAAGTCDSIQELQVLQKDTQSSPHDTHAIIRDTHVIPRAVSIRARATDVRPWYLCPVP